MHKILITSLACVSMAACATTSSAPKKSKNTIGFTSDMNARIAANLPEMKVAEYRDCSIVASLAEQIAATKGGKPVLKRSVIWDIAADKRSNPKTVSLDELLAQPKLMPLLKSMSDGSPSPDGAQAEYKAIATACNEAFNAALSKEAS